MSNILGSSQGLIVMYEHNKTNKPVRIPQEKV